MEKVISLGENIAVLATTATTMKPTLEYVQRKIQASGNPCTVTQILMEEAYYALLEGDMETHDSIVSEGLHSALVMLAQASMARVLQQLPSQPVPVMTSTERGILWLKVLAKIA